MFKKRIKSLGHAVRGVVFCVGNEANFRLELLAAAGVVVAGIVFGLSVAEWLCITGCITLVLVAEVLNTAVEKICDLYSDAYNPKIKIVKDVAAAAVLIAACGSAISGLIIFLPKLITYAQNIF
jgi:diacylglycerol kinase